jgi:hypothetical protein
MRIALLVCQLTSATRQTSFEGFPVGVKSNGGFLRNSTMQPVHKASQYHPGSDCGGQNKCMLTGTHRLSRERGRVIIRFDVAKFSLSFLLCTLGIIVPGWASTAERRFTVTESTNTVLFGGESS